jgi:hypothetical protein
MEDDNIPEQEEQQEEIQQPETHEDIIEKLKIKNKILRYQCLFPKHLIAFQYKMENLEDLSIDQLKSLLTELEVIVNCQNSAGMTKMVYFEGLRIVEKVSPIFGLKLQGLQAALTDNENVINCLHELQLKYESDSFMAPELRLGYCTLSAILSLHKINAGKEVINSLLSEKVNEKIVKEYEDL